jgi:hypothetical protein
MSKQVSRRDFAKTYAGAVGGAVVLPAALLATEPRAGETSRTL